MKAISADRCRQTGFPIPKVMSSVIKEVLFNGWIQEGRGGIMLIMWIDCEYLR